MIIIFAFFAFASAEEHQITAQEDETFTIELASNPTTGYMWKFLEPEARSNGFPLIFQYICVNNQLQASQVLFLINSFRTSNQLKKVRC